MSLIRLLSVGESLVSRQNYTTRYKMRPENQVPNFSIKNGGASMSWRAPNNVVFPCSGLSPTPPQAGPEKTNGRREGQRANRRVVQAELNLDTVRVVRNNLAEDDLEFAPTKREPNPFTSLTEAQKKGPVSIYKFGILARVVQWLRTVRAMF